MSRPILRIPSNIAEVVDEGIVYVAQLPSGPISVLTGAASVIWGEVSGRNRADVVTRVADAMEMSASYIEDDVVLFIDTLISSRLLQEY